MAEGTTQAPPAQGTFCWNELMTGDIEKAKTFYTSLLGWTTEQMDMGPGGTYTLFKTGDTSAGGLMGIDPDAKAQGAQPTWMAYITVDDVDASTKKAESLGAKICVPPTDIPNIGRFSIITDPTGASVGLYKNA